MADKQYDVSPEFRKLFERKQKQRMEFREHYLKHSSNPYRHATGQGGFVFDPAIHRLHAFHEYADEFFRPNYRNTRYLFLAVLFPIGITWAVLRYCRDTENHLIQTGQIAYKDREWKNKL